MEYFIWHGHEEMSRGLSVSDLLKQATLKKRLQVDAMNYGASLLMDFISLSWFTVKELYSPKRLYGRESHVIYCRIQERLFCCPPAFF